MEKSKEFEALKALSSTNFALLGDGRAVYMTQTGEVRDMDTRQLLPPDPARAQQFVANGGSIIPSGASLPTAAPYQQLVTDGEGKWVAEDRLGYKAVEEKVILPETSVTFESVEEPVADLFSSETIAIGETYKVSWDGKEYDCVAYTLFGAIFIGNSSLIGGAVSNNEPFCIGVSGGNTMIFSLDTGTHVISIFGPVVTIYPIPAEYLPKHVVYWSYDKKLDEITGNYQFAMFQDDACTKPVVLSENFVLDLYNGRVNIVAINSNAGPLVCYPSNLSSSNGRFAFRFIGEDYHGSGEIVEYGIWAKVTETGTNS